MDKQPLHSAKTPVRRTHDQTCYRSNTFKSATDGILLQKFRPSQKYIFGCPASPAGLLLYSISRLSNLRPTGRMWPVRRYCAAREVIYVLIVLAELMKYWNQKVLYNDLRINYSTVVANIMGPINKILREIYKTARGPPSDLTDRCAARVWFKLESPALYLCYTESILHNKAINVLQ